MKTDPSWVFLGLVYFVNNVDSSIRYVYMIANASTNMISLNVHGMAYSEDGEITTQNFCACKITLIKDL
jgi:hypothetical protein